MSFPIESLPDETLLNMFEYLEFKDLGRCLQVSKRFRKISLDEKLWQKIKTVDKDVSAEFLIQALTHGAKHLSLESTLLSLYRMPRDQEIDWENLKFHVIYTSSRFDLLEFPKVIYQRILSSGWFAAQSEVQSPKQSFGQQF